MMTASQRATRPRRRWVYPAVAVFITGMVLWGFWASYYASVGSGGLERPWIIHVHAAVFTGWLVLFLAQVTLAATGRVRWHRRLGVFGVAHGILVFITGTAVTFAASSTYVRAGVWEFEPTAAFLLLPIGDMVLFAGFFGAAVAMRRQPDVHRRLMLTATVALSFAGVARLEFAMPVFPLVWLAPMLAVMIDEQLERGRPHPVTLASTATLGIAFMRVFVMDTEAWLPIGRALLAAVL